MTLLRRVRDKARAFLQIYGTGKAKQALWNTEFAKGHWACLDETSGDIVYSVIDKWAHGGSILDLGCGSGNTANELQPDTFRKYTGVDISSIAIDKAITRTPDLSPSRSLHFVKSDVLTYVPAEKFDVILLRDSIYYVATNKISTLLLRYANYLGENGVFIVRMWSTSGKYHKIVELLENKFKIIDKVVSPDSSSLVMVFRPFGPR
jgi:SAM-dependent methyltransferase